MESIIQIRQMMAEQKFYEVQKLIEVELTLKSTSHFELIKLYYQSLKAQEKEIPAILALEYAEIECEQKNYEIVFKLIDQLRSDSQKKFFNQIQKLKVTAAVDLGQMNELYNLLSGFLINQFERQIPHVPSWITENINVYFKNDFNLSLKIMALNLLTSDVQRVESLVRELILTCIEQSSPKAIHEKLKGIGDVLRIGPEKSYLIIYHNLCTIYSEGMTRKKDFKSMTEMIIFFDDFKYQTLILHILDKETLFEEAEKYSETLRSNEEYDFVYFDKYFPHLKKYFVEIKKMESPELDSIETPDLKLEGNYQEELIPPEVDLEEMVDEEKFFHLIKYQSYSTDELCDIAVSFLQSDMPRVALKAAEKATAQADDDQLFLKGSYLKLNSLLLLQDYRAALDTTLEALNKARTSDDILSFLYGQAEAHIRLNQLGPAKKVLIRILSIDSQYRFAKERLDKLNEI